MILFLLSFSWNSNVNGLISGAWEGGFVGFERTPFQVNDEGRKLLIFTF